MLFINGEGRSLSNEPKTKAVSIDDQLIDNTICDVFHEMVDPFESEDDVLVQFGVGGPA